MGTSKGERLAVFLDRLSKAPPASTSQEAVELVNRILDDVENALSGIPYDPAAARQSVVDGRMYGPHSYFARAWKTQGVTRYVHAGHDTFIQENGAILIRLRKPANVLLSKPGADGKEVEP
jgi:hypothetical protein